MQGRCDASRRGARRDRALVHRLDRVARHRGSTLRRSLGGGSPGRSRVAENGGRGAFRLKPKMARVGAYHSDRRHIMGDNLSRPWRVSTGTPASLRYLRLPRPPSLPLLRRKKTKNNRRHTSRTHCAIESKPPTEQARWERLIAAMAREVGRRRGQGSRRRAPVESGASKRWRGVARRG